MHKRMTCMLTISTGALLTGCVPSVDPAEFESSFDRQYGQTVGLTINPQTPPYVEPIISHPTLDATDLTFNYLTTAPFDSTAFTIATPQAVPEPGTFAIWTALGIAGIGARRRRAKAKREAVVTT